MARKRSYYGLDQRLSKVVREQFLLDDHIELFMGTHLDEKPIRCDSLGLVELIIDVEDEFDIRITDAAAEALRTYGDLYRLVAKKVSMVFAVVTQDEKMQVTHVSSKGDYDMQAWAGELYKTWTTFNGATSAITRMSNVVGVSKKLLKVIEVLPNL